MALLGRIAKGALGGMIGGVGGAAIGASMGGKKKAAASPASGGGPVSSTMPVGGPTLSKVEATGGTASPGTAAPLLKRSFGSRPLRGGRR